MTRILISYILPSSLAGAVFTFFLLLLSVFSRRIKLNLKKTSLIIALVVFLLPFSLLQESTDLLTRIFNSYSTFDGPTIDNPVTQSEGFLNRLPTYTTGAYVNMQISEITYNSNSVNTHKTVGYIYSSIGIIYLAGVIVFMTLQILRAVKVYMMLKRTYLPVKDSTYSLYYPIVKEMKIKRVPKLQCSSILSSPILIGVLKPRIILPNYGFSDNELIYVLKHELHHYINRDILKRIVFTIVNAIHWFNLFIFFIRKQFIKVSEELCDEAVTLSLDIGQRVSYATTMLNIAERTSVPVIGFALPVTKLKDRIRRILHPTKSNRVIATTVSILLAVSLVVGILVGCSFAAGTKKNSIDQNSEDSPVQDSLILDDNNTTTSDNEKQQNNLEVSHESEDIVVYIWTGANNYETEDLLIVYDIGTGTTSLPLTMSDLLIYLQESSFASGYCIAYGSERIDEYYIPYATNRISQGVFTTTLGWPVATEPFRNISRGSDEQHTAVDIAVPSDTEVYSAEYGVVLLIGYMPEGYGYYIVIEHPTTKDGKTVKTVYAHLGEIDVFPGEYVNRGQTIGLSGSSGASTGPHMHLELHLDDKRVNPEPYLGFD